MRILVTGCGRTGTQFMARVLSRLGLHVAHETVYNHDLDPLETDPAVIVARWQDWDAEVSWLAAPLLGITPSDVAIWHQVRDPLKSLRCWFKHGILATDERAIHYAKTALSECQEGDARHRGAAYVLGWNNMVEWRVVRCVSQRGSVLYRRYQIESLSAERLQYMLAEAGVMRSVAAIQGVLDGMPADLGTCQHGPEDNLTWADVPNGTALREQAERYGYVYS